MHEGKSNRTHVDDQDPITKRCQSLLVLGQLLLGCLAGLQGQSMSIAQRPRLRMFLAPLFADDGGVHPDAKAMFSYAIGGAHPAI